MSQASGRAGTPDTGHRSSATRSASWTTSSARSKPPSARTSDASSLLPSSRNTASSDVRAPRAPSFVGVIGRSAATLFAVDDGPDLHRAPARPGLRHVEGLVEVGDLDLRVPADDLVALDEGAVRNERRPVPGEANGG